MKNFITWVILLIQYWVDWFLIVEDFVRRKLVTCLQWEKILKFMKIQWDVISRYFLFFEKKCIFIVKFHFNMVSIFLLQHQGFADVTLSLSDPMTLDVCPKGTLYCTLIIYADIPGACILIRLTPSPVAPIIYGQFCKFYLDKISLQNTSKDHKVCYNYIFLYSLSPICCPSMFELVS